MKWKIVSQSHECRNQGFKNKIYEVLWSTTMLDILNMWYYGPCALLLLVQWDDKKAEIQLRYVYYKTVFLYVQIGSGKSQRWLRPPCVVQLEGGWSSVSAPGMQVTWVLLASAVYLEMLLEMLHLMGLTSHIKGGLYSPMEQFTLLSSQVACGSL